MNYIDLNIEGNNSIYLNTKIDAASIFVDWTLTRDGDSEGIVFSTPSDTFSVLNGSYYSSISGNFGDLGLRENSFYSLKGETAEGVILYRGKIFTSSEPIINQNEYTTRVSNSSYTILD